MLLILLEYLVYFCTIAYILEFEILEKVFIKFATTVLYVFRRLLRKLVRLNNKLLWLITFVIFGTLSWVIASFLDFPCFRDFPWLFALVWTYGKNTRIVIRPQNALDRLTWLIEIPVKYICGHRHRSKSIEVRAVEMKPADRYVPLGGENARKKLVIDDLLLSQLDPGNIWDSAKLIVDYYPVSIKQQCKADVPNKRRNYFTTSLSPIASASETSVSFTGGPLSVATSDVSVKVVSGSQSESSANLTRNVLKRSSSASALMVVSRSLTVALCNAALGKASSFSTVGASTLTTVYDPPNSEASCLGPSVSSETSPIVVSRCLAVDACDASSVMSSGSPANAANDSSVVVVSSSTAVRVSSESSSIVGRRSWPAASAWDKSPSADSLSTAQVASESAARVVSGSTSSSAVGDNSALPDFTFMSSCVDWSNGSSDISVVRVTNSDSNIGRPPLPKNAQKRSARRTDDRLLGFLTGIFNNNVKVKYAPPAEEDSLLGFLAEILLMADEYLMLPLSVDSCGASKILEHDSCHSDVKVCNSSDWSVTISTRENDEVFMSSCDSSMYSDDESRDIDFASKDTANAEAISIWGGMLADVGTAHTANGTEPGSLRDDGTVQEADTSSFVDTRTLTLGVGCAAVLGLVWWRLVKS